MLECVCLLDRRHLQKSVPTLEAISGHGTNAQATLRVSACTNLYSGGYMDLPINSHGEFLRVQLTLNPDELLKAQCLGKDFLAIIQHLQLTMHHIFLLLQQLSKGTASAKATRVINLYLLCQT